MRRRVLACVLGLAGPVAAQDGFVIDYPEVFARNAERVMQPTPTRRVLELPGPVIVTEDRLADGTLRYTGEDQSGLDAPGCILGTLIRVSAAISLCPQALPEVDRRLAVLATYTAASFFAKNTIPAMSEAAMTASFDRSLRATERLFAGQVCPAPGTIGLDTTPLGRALATPTATDAQLRSLDTPRLPVSAPCN